MTLKDNCSDVYCWMIKLSVGGRSAYAADGRICDDLKQKD